MTYTIKENSTSKFIWIVIGASILYILLKGGSSTQVLSKSHEQQLTYNWNPLDKIPSVDDLKLIQPSTINTVQQNSIQQNSILDKIERLEQIVNRIEQIQATQMKSPISQNPVNISSVVQDIETHSPTEQIKQNLETTASTGIPVKVEISAPIVIPATPIVKVEKVETPASIVIPAPTYAPIVKVEMTTKPEILQKSEIPKEKIPLEKIPTPLGQTPLEKTEITSPDVKVEIPSEAPRTYKNNEKWKITRNKKGDIVSIEVVRNAEINGDKRQ